MRCSSEYVPFIVLVVQSLCDQRRHSLEGDLPAHSFTNAMFLLVGGVLASFIGTTGAAMLLIRPLLETNSERKYVVHTVIFFIFIVCNCGGCLLPIGRSAVVFGIFAGSSFPIYASLVERMALCKWTFDCDLLSLGSILVLSA